MCIVFAIATVGNVVAQDGVTLEDTMQPGNLENLSETIIDDFLLMYSLALLSS